VPSKSRKLSSADIVAFEARRDIGAEILQSIKDMKAGKGKVVASSATEAREATGLSQSQFASLLGVSVRILQGWAQGRGWYSTQLTPEGYAVESESHLGSVKIYPVAALERVA